MWLALLLIVIVVVLSIFYYKRKHYTMFGPLPGVAPEFLRGNLRQAGLTDGKPLATALREWQTKFGDVFQFWFGPTRFVILCNIDDAEHVFSHRQLYDQAALRLEKDSLFFRDALICSVGAKYKRHATLTMPLFRRARLISNLDLINDCTDKLLDQWRSKNSEDPNRIYTDVAKQCQNLLFAIFGYVAFDYDLETLDEKHTDDTGNQLMKALRIFIDTFVMAFRVPMFVIKTYLMVSPRYRRALATIHKHLNRIIDIELSKNPDEISQRKRTSLIASLVDSLQQNEKLEATKSEENKKGLSRAEVMNEMLLFLIAGYETTSTALLWFIHLVSKNPRVQTKLKAELGELRHQHLTIEQLDSLSYLDCVLREVLRFVPPANGSVRSLTNDDRLPGSGVQLHRGDQVMIPFHNLTRDSRYWKIDPDRFYPERFESDDKNHLPLASIPFGSGHRQCVGQELAKLELKTVAARLMQQVTFGDGGSDVNAGEYEQKLTIMPKHFAVTIKFDSI